MLNIIPEKLALIFNAKSIEESCSILNSSLEQLNSLNLLSSLPLKYQNVFVRSPEEVQEWFDLMITRCATVICMAYLTQL